MRWAFVVAILMACKGDKPPTQQVVTGSGSGEEKPALKVGVPERPSLPVKQPGKASNDVFEAEARDAEWAPTVESGIKQRFEKVRGAKLEATECRRTQCRLTIVGVEGDLAQTIADLEGSRGLHGYARSILLSAPVPKSDGTIELRAFAQFDR